MPTALSQNDFRVMTYTPISDAELAEISAQTARRDETEPRIASARYDAETGRLMLEMKGGASISVAARSLRDLAEASDENLAQIEVVSNGNALHWDELDVQFSTIALLQMIFRIRGSLEDNGDKNGRSRKEVAA